MYNIWDSMIQRCTNANRKDFMKYGGRGITVCDRWRTFDNFLEDMGDRPEGKTLDRMNNNLGYCKENCRWASPMQQSRNMSTNRFFEYKGMTKCMSDWAEYAGMGPSVLRHRLLKGMDFESAISTPVAKRTKRQ